MTYFSIRGADRFGAVTLDGWTAFPTAGTPEADPYSKARLARDAQLALGIAEGVTFFVNLDETGSPLTGSCDYIIEGNAPPARFWTLNVTSAQHRLFASSNTDLPTMLHSALIGYEPDGEMVVHLSSIARPGNWLATPSESTYALAMTLFDSPIASNKGLIDTVFPKIRKADCRD